VERGIFKGEVLAVPVAKRGTAVWDRTLTVAVGRGAEELLGARVKVRVLENEHNIYIAAPVGRRLPPQAHYIYNRE